MPRSNEAASPRSIVVIPARYASTRLPRKMLLRETGKTLLQHTYEAASAASKPGAVIVATDHPEIAREVERFHGDFVMTSADCASGTDRVAEVARKMPRAEILVNVQGDEPEMMPENIDRVIALLEQSPTAGMATLATPIRSAEQLDESGMRESRLRRSGSRDVFQPQPNSVRARSRIPRRSSMIPCCSTSILVSTHTGGKRCSMSPKCPRHRWSKRKSLNSCACCNRAAPSSSRQLSIRRAVSTRQLIMRRLWPAGERPGEPDGMDRDLSCKMRR